MEWSVRSNDSDLVRSRHPHIPQVDRNEALRRSLPFFKPRLGATPKTISSKSFNQVHSDARDVKQDLPVDTAPLRVVLDRSGKNSFATFMQIKTRQFSEKAHLKPIVDRSTSPFTNQVNRDGGIYGRGLNQQLPQDAAKEGTNSLYAEFLMMNQGQGHGRSPLGVIKQSPSCHPSLVSQDRLTTPYHEANNQSMHGNRSQRLSFDKEDTKSLYGDFLDMTQDPLYAEFLAMNKGQGSNRNAFGARKDLSYDQLTKANSESNSAVCNSGSERRQRKSYESSISGDFLDTVAVGCSHTRHKDKCSDAFNTMNDTRKKRNKNKEDAISNPVTALSDAMSYHTNNGVTGDGSHGYKNANFEECNQESVHQRDREAFKETTHWSMKHNLSRKAIKPEIRKISKKLVNESSSDTKEIQYGIFRDESIIESCTDVKNKRDPDDNETTKTSKTIEWVLQNVLTDAFQTIHGIKKKIHQNNELEAHNSDHYQMDTREPDSVKISDWIIKCLLTDAFNTMNDTRKKRNQNKEDAISNPVTALPDAMSYHTNNGVTGDGSHEYKNANFEECNQESVHQRDREAFKEITHWSMKQNLSRKAIKPEIRKISKKLSNESRSDTKEIRYGIIADESIIESCTDVKNKRDPDDNETTKTSKTVEWVLQNVLTDAFQTIHGIKKKIHQNKELEAHNSDHYQMDTPEPDSVKISDWIIKCLLTDAFNTMNDTRKKRNQNKEDAISNPVTALPDAMSYHTNNGATGDGSHGYKNANFEECNQESVHQRDREAFKETTHWSMKHNLSRKAIKPEIRKISKKLSNAISSDTKEIRYGIFADESIIESCTNVKNKRDPDDNETTKTVEWVLKNVLTDAFQTIHGIKKKIHQNKELEAHNSDHYQMDTREPDSFKISDWIIKCLLTDAFNTMNDTRKKRNQNKEDAISNPVTALPDAMSYHTNNGVTGDGSHGYKNANFEECNQESVHQRDREAFKETTHWSMKHNLSRKAIKPEIRRISTKLSNESSSDTKIIRYGIFTDESIIESCTDVKNKRDPDDNETTKTSKTVEWVLQNVLTDAFQTIHGIKKKIHQNKELEAHNSDHYQMDTREPDSVKISDWIIKCLLTDAFNTMNDTRKKRNQNKEDAISNPVTALPDAMSYHTNNGVTGDGSHGYKNANFEECNQESVHQRDREAFKETTHWSMKHNLSRKAIKPEIRKISKKLSNESSSDTKEIRYGIFADESIIESCTDVKNKRDPDDNETTKTSKTVEWVLQNVLTDAFQTIHGIKKKIHQNKELEAHNSDHYQMDTPEPDSVKISDWIIKCLLTDAFNTMNDTRKKRNQNKEDAISNPVTALPDAMSYHTNNGVTGDGSHGYKNANFEECNQESVHQRDREAFKETTHWSMKHNLSRKAIKPEIRKISKKLSNAISSDTKEIRYGIFADESIIESCTNVKNKRDPDDNETTKTVEWVLQNVLTDAFQTIHGIKKKIHQNKELEANNSDHYQMDTREPDSFKISDWIIKCLLTDAFNTMNDTRKKRNQNKEDAISNPVTALPDAMSYHTNNGVTGDESHGYKNANFEECNQESVHQRDREAFKETTHWSMKHNLSRKAIKPEIRRISTKLSNESSSDTKIIRYGIFADESIIESCTDVKNKRDPDHNETTKTSKTVEWVLQNVLTDAFQTIHGIKKKIHQNKELEAHNSDHYQMDTREPDSVKISDWIIKCLLTDAFNTMNDTRKKRNQNKEDAISNPVTALPDAMSYHTNNGVTGDGSHGYKNANFEECNQESVHQRDREAFKETTHWSMKHNFSRKAIKPEIRKISKKLSNESSSDTKEIRYGIIADKSIIESCTDVKNKRDPDDNETTKTSKTVEWVLQNVLTDAFQTIHGIKKKIHQNKELEAHNSDHYQMDTREPDSFKISDWIIKCLLTDAFNTMNDTRKKRNQNKEDAISNPVTALPDAMSYHTNNGVTGDGSHGYKNANFEECNQESVHQRDREAFKETTHWSMKHNLSRKAIKPEIRKISKKLSNESSSDTKEIRYGIIADESIIESCTDVKNKRDPDDNETTKTNKTVEWVLQNVLTDAFQTIHGIKKKIHQNKELEAHNSDHYQMDTREPDSVKISDWIIKYLLTDAFNTMNDTRKKRNQNKEDAISNPVTALPDAMSYHTNNGATGDGSHGYKNANFEECNQESVHQRDREAFKETTHWSMKHNLSRKAIKPEIRKISKKLSNESSSDTKEIRYGIFADESIIESCTDVKNKRDPDHNETTKTSKTVEWVLQNVLTDAFQTIHGIKKKIHQNKELEAHNSDHYQMDTREPDSVKISDWIIKCLLTDAFNTMNDTRKKRNQNKEDAISNPVTALPDAMSYHTNNGATGDGSHGYKNANFEERNQESVHQRDREAFKETTHWSLKHNLSRKAIKPEIRKISKKLSNESSSDTKEIRYGIIADESIIKSCTDVKNKRDPDDNETTKTNKTVEWVLQNVLTDAFQTIHGIKKKIHQNKELEAHNSDHYQMDTREPDSVKISDWIIKYLLTDAFNTMNDTRKKRNQNKEDAISNPVTALPDAMSYHTNNGVTGDGSHGYKTANFEECNQESVHQRDREAFKETTHWSMKHNLSRKAIKPEIRKISKKLSNESSSDTKEIRYGIFADESIIESCTDVKNKRDPDHNETTKTSKTVEWVLQNVLTDAFQTIHGIKKKIHQNKELEAHNSDHYQMDTREPDSVKISDWIIKCLLTDAFNTMNDTRKKRNQNKEDAISNPVTALPDAMSYHTNNSATGDGSHGYKNANFEERNQESVHQRDREAFKETTHWSLKHNLSRKAIKPEIRKISKKLSNAISSDTKEIRYGIFADESIIESCTNVKNKRDPDHNETTKTVEWVLQNVLTDAFQTIHDIKKKIHQNKELEAHNSDHYQMDTREPDSVKISDWIIKCLLTDAFNTMNDTRKKRNQNKEDANSNPVTALPDAMSYHTNNGATGDGSHGYKNANFEECNQESVHQRDREAFKEITHWSMKHNLSRKAIKPEIRRISKKLSNESSSDTKIIRYGIFADESIIESCTDVKNKRDPDDNETTKTSKTVEWVLQNVLTDAFQTIHGIKKKIHQNKELEAHNSDHYQMDTRESDSVKISDWIIKRLLTDAFNTMNDTRKKRNQNKEDAISNPVTALPDAMSYHTNNGATGDGSHGYKNANFEECNQESVHQRDREAFKETTHWSMKHNFSRKAIKPEIRKISKKLSNESSSDTKEIRYGIIADESIIESCTDVKNKRDPDDNETTKTSKTVEWVLQNVLTDAFQTIHGIKKKIHQNKELEAHNSDHYQMDTREPDSVKISDWIIKCLLTDAFNTMNDTRKKRNQNKEDAISNPVTALPDAMSYHTNNGATGDGSYGYKNANFEECNQESVHQRDREAFKETTHWSMKHNLSRKAIKPEIRKISKKLSNESSSDTKEIRYGIFADESIIESCTDVKNKRDPDDNETTKTSKTVEWVLQNVLTDAFQTIHGIKKKIHQNKELEAHNSDHYQMDTREPDSVKISDWIIKCLLTDAFNTMNDTRKKRNQNKEDANSNPVTALPDAMSYHTNNGATGDGSHGYKNANFEECNQESVHQRDREAFKETTHWSMKHNLSRKAIKPEIRKISKKLSNESSSDTKEIQYGIFADESIIESCTDVKEIQSNKSTEKTTIGNIANSQEVQSKQVPDKINNESTTGTQSTQGAVLSEKSIVVNVQEAKPVNLTDMEKIFNAGISDYKDIKIKNLTNKTADENNADAQERLRNILTKTTENEIDADTLSIQSDRVTDKTDNERVANVQTSTTDETNTDKYQTESKTNESISTWPRRKRSHMTMAKDVCISVDSQTNNTTITKDSSGTETHSSSSTISIGKKNAKTDEIYIDKYHPESKADESISTLHDRKRSHRASSKHASASVGSKSDCTSDVNKRNLLSPKTDKTTTLKNKKNMYRKTPKGARNASGTQAEDEGISSRKQIQNAGTSIRLETNNVGIFVRKQTRNADISDGTQPKDVGICSGTQTKNISICSGIQAKDAFISSETQIKDALISSETQTKDIGISSGTQTKDNGITSGTQTKDVGVSCETQTKDAGISIGTQTKNAIICSETQTNDAGICMGTQTKDSGITSGTQTKDVGVSCETQTKDAGISIGTQTKNAIICSETQTNDAGICMGTQTKDSGITSGTQTRNDGIFIGTQAKDTGISIGTKTIIAGFSTRTQTKIAGICSGTQTKDAGISIRTQTKGVSISMGTQTKNVDVSIGVNAKDAEISIGTQSKDATISTETHTKDDGTSIGTQIKDDSISTGLHIKDGGIPSGTFTKDAGICSGTRTKDGGFSSGTQTKNAVISSGPYTNDAVISIGPQIKNAIISTTIQIKDGGISIGTQTKDAGISIGTQTKDAGISIGTQTKDAGISIGTQTKDAGISIGTQTKDAIISNGTQTKDAIISIGTQTKDAIISNGAQTKDAGISIGTQSKDAGVSIGTTSKNATSSIETQTKGASISNGTQIKDASICMGTQTRNGGACIGTNTKDAIISIATQTKDAGNSTGLQIKNDGISSETFTKYAAISSETRTKDGGFSSGTQAEDAEISSGPNTTTDRSKEIYFNRYENNTEKSPTPSNANESIKKVQSRKRSHRTRIKTGNTSVGSHTNIDKFDQTTVFHRENIGETSPKDTGHSSRTQINDVASSGTKIKDAVFSSGSYIKDAIISRGTHTNDAIISSGTQIQNAIISNGTQTKDAVIFNGTQIQDAINSSVTQITDAIFSNGTQTKEAIISCVTQIQDDIISSKTQTKDAAISSGPQIQDAIISSVTQIKDAIFSSGTQIQNAIISSRTQKKDAIIFSGTQIQDDIISSKTQTKDAVISSGPQIQDAIISCKTQTKDAIISCKTKTKDAIISCKTKTKDAIISSGAQIQDAIISCKTQTKDAIISCKTKTKDAIISSGAQIQDAIISSGTQTKDALISSGTQIQDAIISSRIKTQHAIISSGTQTKDAVISSGTQMQNAIISSGTLTKDAVISYGTQVQDAVISNGTKMQDAINSSVTQIKDAIFSNGTQTTDAIISSGTQIQDAINSGRTQNKDAIISSRAQIQDAIISSRIQIQDAIISSGTQTKDDIIFNGAQIQDAINSSVIQIKEAIFSSGTQTKEAIISSVTQIKDDIISSKTQTKDAAISSGPQIQDAIISSVTQIKDAIFSSGTQIQNAIISSRTQKKDAIIFSGTQIQDDIISSKTQTKDAVISSGPQIQDAIISCKTQTKDAIISCKTKTKDAIISSGSHLQDAIISCKTQTKDAIISCKTKTKDSIISSGAQIQDAIISSGTQTKDAVISSGTQIQDAIISSGTQTKDAVISSGTQMQNGIISSGTLTKDAVISYGTQVQDAVISYGTKMQDAINSSVTQIKDAIFSNGTQTKDVIISSRTQIQDAINSGRTQNKDAIISSRAQIQDAIISSRIQIQDAIISSGTQTKDDIIFNGTQIQDAINSSVTQIKDAILSNGTQTKDAIISSGTQMRDAINSSRTNIQDAIISSGRQIQDAIISNRTQIQDAVISSRTQIQDAIISRGTQTKDAIISSGTHTKDAIISNRPRTNYAVISNGTQIKDAIISSGTQTKYSYSSKPCVNKNNSEIDLVKSPRTSHRSEQRDGCSVCDRLVEAVEKCNGRWIRNTEGTCGAMQQRDRLIRDGEKCKERYSRHMQATLDARAHESRQVTDDAKCNTHWKKYIERHIAEFYEARQQGIPSIDAYHNVVAASIGSQTYHTRACPGERIDQHVEPVELRQSQRMAREQKQTRPDAELAGSCTKHSVDTLPADDDEETVTGCFGRRRRKTQPQRNNSNQAPRRGNRMTRLIRRVRHWFA